MKILKNTLIVSSYVYTLLFYPSNRCVPQCAALCLGCGAVFLKLFFNYI